MSVRRAAGISRGILPALFLLLLPTAAVGQTLDERQREYRAALAGYEAAVALRNVYSTRFYVLLDSLSAARSTGEESVVDDLEGRVRSVSLELQSEDAWVEEAAAALQEARESLLGALDQRLDSLQFVVVAATDPVRRQDARTEIASLRNRYAAVEEEDLRDILERDRVRPLGITYEQRDTQATLRAKAELLESKAQEFQLEIDAVDQALERYRRAVQLERIAGDARSTIDRFGDTQVPVRGRTTGSRGDQGMATDTIPVVDLDALPPQDAIRQLESLRQVLVYERDRILRLAREFRDRIGVVRGLGGER